MSDKIGGNPVELLGALKERAKELACLYRVEECLSDPDRPLPEVLASVVEAIPRAMQDPEAARAFITYGSTTYGAGDGAPPPSCLSTPIKVQDQTMGSVCVYYVAPPSEAGQDPFLPEEVRLLRTIADRLGHFVLFQRMRSVRLGWEEKHGTDWLGPWHGSLRLLRTSDRPLYLKIARKMLNHLYGMGIEEARRVLQQADVLREPDEVGGQINVPGRQQHANPAVLLSDRPFEVAARHLDDETIMALLQRWLQEDKASFFVKTLSSPSSSLREISAALRRFHNLTADGAGIFGEVLSGVKVSLVRRFLTEELDYLKIAKDVFEIHDFDEICQRLVMPEESHGRLGGKCAGLLLAHNILVRRPDAARPVGDVKVPRTWHISSDAILQFISHNDLEDVIEHKYKDNARIRHEYPNIVQLFKDSKFPPDMVQALTLALDDFGEVPLVIRSSSLLEDRLGTAFSGKYKSLFISNQGDKQTRLNALLDAIAEVYASVFGPDPIEYRREHGLLEFSEEMGILIQAVVGTRAGRYFLPAFAGVAFSNNEFRWSPRIRREDGIVRLVPGLGTRAVDRLGDDYPVLLVPGQAGLRANVAIPDIVRYSPHKVDVINLETGTLETRDIRALLQEVGTEYPAFERVFSVLRRDGFEKAVRVLTDPRTDELVTTFEGLFAATPFVAQMKNVLSVLQETLGTPVDVEFAHDGRDLYLLQCRPQSYHGEDAPAPIPKDVEEEDVVFSARRFVSNGWVPDLTHIVYVQPEGYGALADRKDLLAVGAAVGRLNQLLPRRQFALVGPGRWGSRGDIRLGVSVTYADISNTAMMVEVAWRKGGYVPDLSFGTHFFQDLVESRIRYLPIYPDDEGIRFNAAFLDRSANRLPELLPEYAHLAPVLRVIDVPAVTGGRVLRVAMNAELDEALAWLGAPADAAQETAGAPADAPPRPARHARWRLQVAEQIARCLDPDRFGVAALYVFGNTMDGTAGPGSDLDLLVHFRGDERQKQDLLTWFEGWSLALAEANYLQTGHRTAGLLDVHFLTDEDVARRSRSTVQVGAVTDEARELPLSRPDRDPPRAV